MERDLFGCLKQCSPIRNSNFDHTLKMILLNIRRNLYFAFFLLFTCYSKIKKIIKHYLETIFFYKPSVVLLDVFFLLTNIFATIIPIILWFFSQELLIFTDILSDYFVWDLFLHKISVNKSLVTCFQIRTKCYVCIYIL